MHMPQVAPAGSPAKSEKPKGAIATLRDLWPYMWPKDRRDLKQRVLVALGVLIGAKIITVLVPYTYKWATDALTGSRRGLPPDAHPELGLAVILTVPIMLVVANGVGRILMNVFNNLRAPRAFYPLRHLIRHLAGRGVFLA